MRPAFQSRTAALHHAAFVLVPRLVKRRTPRAISAHRNRRGWVLTQQPIAQWPTPQG